MKIVLNPNSVEDYLIFVKAKALPRFRCVGHQIEIPDEYASMLGVNPPRASRDKRYTPTEGLFDYQRDISKLAIRKRKFGVFADPGLGKTLILGEFVRHAFLVLPNKRHLIISPLMVVEQTLEEFEKWYGKKMPVDQVKAKNLSTWINGSDGRIGITNYDALTDETPQGNLGSLSLDESSMLKSAYGKWGTTCIRLGDGLEWKTCYTGTPAPNDRIEYANHAVFLDAFPTHNSFLARYFVNKGQTSERWQLKSHAVEAFYRDLSDWCIFLTNPATYGWKDNCDSIPPIHVHIHDIDLTGEQRDAVYSLTGKLFVESGNGIVTRGKLSQIGKGKYNGGHIASNKPAYIKKLVESWSDESTIIWCHYNDEQDAMEKLFPGCVSISGSTPHEKRMEMIRSFKNGTKKVLISKAKVMGFGLNLQKCTRMIFSGMKDSYEEFFQAVKRANRVGSSLPLNVHVPTTEVERPQVENTLRKAARVQADTEEQERTFKKNGVLRWS